MKCAYADSSFYEQPCEGDWMVGINKPFKPIFACKKHATANKQVSPFNGVTYKHMTPMQRKTIERTENMWERAKETK